VYVKAERDGTPNPQLKAFRKVRLQPGEERVVSIQLPPEAFGLYDEAGNRSIRQGTYTVYAGASQPDRRSRSLTGKSPAAFTLTADRDIEL